jgi:hypothetical protein
VRASIGLGTTTGDIDALAGALPAIRRTGPVARYAYDAGRDEYAPDTVCASAA